MKNLLTKQIRGKRISIVLLCSAAVFIYAFFLKAESAQEGSAIFIYDSHQKRDPFVPLLGLAQARAMGVSEVTSIDDVDFQGIASDAKGLKVIIINGEMLKEGSTLDALTVKKISETEAIIVIRGEEFNLNFYEKEEE